MTRPGTKKRLALAGEWYDARLAVHHRLAHKIKNLLEEILSTKGIPFDRIEARVKTRKSFLDKASKKIAGRVKYSAPIEQIKDLVGIRVITLLDSTVAEVSAVLEAELEIDVSNSLDKTSALGTDRVGYRSKHYVTRLGPRRSEVAECADFKDLSFEIQVRSLLQHAWAEMEHDRRFKYAGELPDEIKRRFSLVAAQLEAADHEFNKKTWLGRLTSALYGPLVRRPDARPAKPSHSSIQRGICADSSLPLFDQGSLSLG